MRRIYIGELWLNRTLRHVLRSNFSDYFLCILALETELEYVMPWEMAMPRFGTRFGNCAYCTVMLDC